MYIYIYMCVCIYIYIYTVLAHRNNRSMEGNTFQGLCCPSYMYQSNTRFREWFSKVPQRFWSCTSVHPVNATLKYTFISQEPTQQNKPLSNPNNHHPSMRPPFTHCNRHPYMRPPFTHAAALHPLQPPSINEAALHP